MVSKRENPSSYVTRIRGLKESPQDVALRALRAITKSNKSAIQLENVPNDFLFGESIDLQRWTIILKDKDLKELSEQQSLNKKYYLDGSAPTMAGVFRFFSIPQDYSHGLLKLNITAAKEVTDYGIAMIARKSPSLNTLILTGCIQITDIGLREIAMHCSQLQQLNISSCPNIEGVGIAAIAECCPYLNKLNISKNSTIKNWSLQKIFRKCLRLEELNISYMKEISDEEIRIVAENCHDLIQFEAIDCVYLSDQSMLTLSQYCKDLDYLDLSRNEMTYRITDVTLMALGQRCHSLRTLKLNHCDHITDIGVHWLSEGCKILETLELYGCSKLTDAAMRILGKECHALTSIDISLAKSISDVGIANLARGCKNLTKLKCHGEYLLCDPRFFAESIQNRVPVSAKEDKSEEDFINNSSALLTSKSTSALSVEPSMITMSDEGGSGGGGGAPIEPMALFENTLPNLKTPNSRKANTKKLEIWEESIGIVALVNFCPLLSQLDLSGCFRLNRVLGKSVSRLSHLLILNLKGCNEVSPQSLIALFSKLQKLEELNLSDCGKGVNNEVLETIAHSCRNLKILYAARCFEITGKGIKAISNLSLLEKLDLSGCKYLTDSRLVHIVSSDKVKHLQTLDVSSIPKLTDSFLAWISMKDHKLFHVSLKGTEITQKALLSVKDRFPYCDLLMNDNYYGFWPKFRVMDRVLINQYATMMRGLVTFQSKVRKMIATRRVNNILQERRTLAAHVLLHRIVRGFLGRCRARKIKAQYLLSNFSAEKLTSLFHGIQARKRIQKIKKNRHQRYLHEQCILIQCAFRIYRAKCRVDAIYEQRALMKEKRKKAAIIIQSIGRMYLGKCYYYKKKELNRKQLIFINLKAALIQRLYRGYATRNHVVRMKAIVLAVQRKRVHSVNILRRAYRSYRMRRNLYERINHRRLRHYAAVMIQSLARGFVTRLHYAEIVFEKQLIARTTAAIKIQCIYRVFVAKKIFLAKIRAIHQQRKLFSDAATCIVRQAKMKLARLALQRRRQAYLQKLKEQTQHTLNACIKIQSIMRRYLCQKHYYAKLSAVKNQWKELFDETKKKRFFYNKLTGEIRWKIPQDLLDLIPNPKCDNCMNLDAMIECRQCGELFCADCFRMIHGNGRRKEHEFRSLYDYYGKRIDYGDGDEEDNPNYQEGRGGTTVQNGKMYYISSDSGSDGESETKRTKKSSKSKKTKPTSASAMYPCQWPTELIQDEIQGWMLRVAPFRRPLQVYPASGWEQYQLNEEDYQALQKSIDNIRTSEEQRRIQKLIMKSTPKVFYFNRNTFQTTYEIPEEVRKETMMQSRPSSQPRTAGSASSFLFSPTSDGKDGVDPSMSYYGSAYEPYNHNVPYSNDNTPYRPMTMDPSQAFMYQTPGGTLRPAMANTAPVTEAQDPMMQTRGSSVMNSRGGTRHQHYYYPAYYYQQPGFSAAAAMTVQQTPLTAFSKSGDTNDFSAPGTSDNSVQVPQSAITPNDPNNANSYYYYYHYPSGPTTAGSQANISGEGSNLQTPYQAPSSSGSYWYASPSPGTANPQGTVPPTAGDPNNIPTEAMGYYDEYGQWQWYDYSQQGYYQYPNQYQYPENQQDLYYANNISHLQQSSSVTINSNSLSKATENFSPIKSSMQTGAMKEEEDSDGESGSSEYTEDDEDEDDN